MDNDRLIDSNPELFENETLGEATATPFLDQEEAQKTEDFNARIEGREPRIVIAENRYPQFMPSGSVPSDIQPELSFKGEDTGPNPDGENPESFISPEVQTLIDGA